MTIMVGMSGGVDSSVAALLMKQRGDDTAGLFMKNWEEDDSDQYCAASADVADARAVCAALGIELHTVNLSAEYWDHVFEAFLEGYRSGVTPNPDILCNREIKFKAFLEHALDLGAEAIATGHYARRDEQDGRYRLLKGLDPGKDQSYFLHALDQHQLAHARFPVGELLKSEVRRIAADNRLDVHDKKDSTGICFIGERPFREFLSRYLPAQPGEIRDLDDRTLGEHPGAVYFTLGQRKGLGLGGVAGGVESAWYVVEKDLEQNILYVAQGHDHPLLFSQGLEAGDIHWISGEPPSRRLHCTAKTRYRQPDQACRVDLREDGCVKVSFEQPQRAVTPGQSVVFYSGEECLGGGIIRSTQRYSSATN